MIRNSLKISVIVLITLIITFLSPVPDFLKDENHFVLSNISSIVTILSSITLIFAFIVFVLNIENKELSIFPYNNKIFIIWNSGSEPIFRHDIANRKLLGLTIKNDTETKDIDVLEVENSPMELEKKLDPRDRNRIVFDFDFIDKGQGFVVKIPYDNDNVHLFDCKVIGGEFQYRKTLFKRTTLDENAGYKINNLANILIKTLKTIVFVFIFTCISIVVLACLRGFVFITLSELLVILYVIGGIIILAEIILSTRFWRLRRIPENLISLVEPRNTSEEITLRMWLNRQWDRFHQRY